MADPNPSHKGDILVVDDRADNLRLLSKMLSDHGYKVRKVIKGELAFDVVQVNPPDLILLDIVMPFISGFEVCQQLKADERTRAIPIIFLSASDEPLDKVKAFSVGGTDYITKPFEMSEVLARIEHQLQIVRLQAQMRLQNQQLKLEVAERLKAEASLQEINNDLEKRVRNRTTELTHANQQLTLLGEKLQKSLNQEQELNRLKSQIITTISHEYRTPMAVIVSSTGILENYFDRLTDELRSKHLGRIQGAIQRMTDLIEDVMLLNKLEFDPVVINLSSVNLKSLIDMAISDATHAGSLSHVIQIDIAEQCLRPKTDASLLRSIIAQLICNAIKFSPDKSTIHIFAGCNSGHFFITVRDQGIGIPKADIEHIFAPFFRASNTNNIQGVGIGLATVKRSVDLLSGRIHIDSQLEGGTTFTITFPTGQ